MITKITGYTYLTFENFFSFLFEPVAFLFILLLLLILTFFTLIDISTVIIILDASYQKKKISIITSFKMGLRKALLVFKRKNILFGLLVIFLIPFLHIGISSGLISTISIPEFILDYIFNNNVLLCVYIIVVLILLYFMFRYLYALHYFVLEDASFKEALKKSSKLSYKHKLAAFFAIVLGQGSIMLLYLIFVFGGIFLIFFLNNYFKTVNFLNSLSITLIWLVLAISFVILLLLSTPISYGIISKLFYKYKDQAKEDIKHIKVVLEEKKRSKAATIFKINFFLIVIILGTILTIMIRNGEANLNIEHMRITEVTAHRGASSSYPENTMSAFRGAKEQDADWIELDVQQTKDQKIVVLHDTNLKRTTGVNKNTWEMTYDEIRKLDAGIFFSKEFKSEKIPSLEEVIDYAKENGIRLNIELKPTGKEVDFEKSVVDIIREKDFLNNCVVTSQVYDVLKKVKQYDIDVETIYVMTLAYGNITNLNYADGYSIEATSINPSLVELIHNKGKEVYAWTINTEESINSMIEMNVDNIITDDVVLAKDLIYKSRTSDLVMEYVKLVQNIFG